MGDSQADLGDLPAEQRRDRDESREHPDSEDHEHDPERGPLGEVVDGLGARLPDGKI